MAQVVMATGQIHKKIATFFLNVKILRLPFDWKTPSGYLIAVIFQSMLAAYHFFLTSTITTFGIGTYLFLLSPIEDIKVNFDSTTHRKPNMQRTPRIRNVRKLCEFVEIHADSKQLSDSVLKNEINSIF